MDGILRPKPATTRDVVYAKLKEDIIKLDLKPGMPLSENEMSIKFQVSRTPVRESFVRLAQEGLVEVLPQRGTFVSLIDSDLVEEGRFMREHLERAVVRLACEHFPKEALSLLEQNLGQQAESLRLHDNYAMFELDEEFHSILFSGCGKSMTWAAIGQMNTHLKRSRMLRLVDNHDWLHLFEQHKAMVAAISAHLPEEADRLMKEHLSLNIADQAILKEKYPSYYK